jgi:glycosyltransferase involved in cell wall biosynthesis
MRIDLRVAIVINTSWNIYNYRQGLIKSLLDKGVEVIAIAPKDDFSQKLIELGCDFVPLSMDNKGINPLKDILLFFRFLFLYKKIQPDCILHYTIKPNVYGSIAAGILRIPCISNVSGLGTVFIRQGIILSLVKHLYRFAFRFPKKVFFQNKDDQKLFKELELLNSYKSDVLPGSGINLSMYQSLPFKNTNPFTFLLISRLLVDKGIVEYAEASRLLKARGFDFQSVLVGFFDRTSKYNISNADIEGWEKQGYIVFKGESQNIISEIEKADCIVLPSYREGTPRSLLEAMALGKPIITTNVPGCKDVIEDGSNGFICEAKNVKSLANAMERMLELDSDALQDMGQKGRDLVENRFDERIVVEKYLMEIFTKFASE